MSIVYGVTDKALLVALPDVTRTFFFITLDGQIPSSAKRYSTRTGAEREAARRRAAQAREEAIRTRQVRAASYRAWNNR